MQINPNFDQQTQSQSPQQVTVSGAEMLPPEPKVRKKLLIILGLVVLVVVAILATALFLARSKNNAELSSQSKVVHQEYKWQAALDNVRLAEEKIAAGQLDEAKAILDAIDKDYPDQSKVAALLSKIQVEKDKTVTNTSGDDSTVTGPSSSGASRPRTSAPAAVPFSTPITIKGDSVCQNKTLSALKFLSQRASVHYTNVVKYVSTIECIPAGSGMYSSEKRYVVGNDTRDSGDLWYASTIAHDACHSWQYHTGLPSSGDSSESQCLDVQYDALVKMGASQYYLDYLKTQYDSKYWDIPYEGRYW